MSGPTRDLRVGLRRALDNGELSLAFQPEYDLRTLEIPAVETLMRWNHPHFGEVEPSDFIAVAEESSLIVELGQGALGAALVQFASWTGQLQDRDVVLRINVAIAQLAQPDFVLEVENALRRHGVRPERLCIEITESAPLLDPVGIGDVVRRLQALGVLVAIDDLANGYSTLGSLRVLPVDILKIDRSLVSGIDTDVRAAIILSAIVTMSNELDVVLVAEGVENEREAAVLVSLGCTRAQGHYLGRPMAGTAILDLLRGPGSRRRPEPGRLPTSSVTPRPRPLPRGPQTGRTP